QRMTHIPVLYVPAASRLFSKIVARTLVSAASTLMSRLFGSAPDPPFRTIFILCCALDRRMPALLDAACRSACATRPPHEAAIPRVPLVIRSTLLWPLLKPTRTLFPFTG